MKRNFKRFISLFMTLTLMLSVSVMDGKHVHAEETLSETLLTKTVETTAEEFFAVVEFTAPYDETYTFLSENITDLSWDGYGFLFDDSVDVEQIITNAEAAIADGETNASNMITEGFIASADDGNGSYPLMDVDLAKGETCTFVLCGFNTDCYGEAEIKINLTHGARVIKNRLVTSCSEISYSGDIYCGLESCGKLLEEGKDIEPHTPDNEITNEVLANCYVDGYTGDAVCNICKAETKGTVTTISEHKYENNICTYCGNIEYAKLGETYTLETTEGLPYKVIGFKAPSSASFKFYTEHSDDKNWDGYGYLFDDSVDVDQMIKDGIADIPVNEENTRLSGAMYTDDDSNNNSGHDNMPVIVESLTKDKTYYFVVGGFSDDNYGKFNVTVFCTHENTELRNKTITSCTDGGYIGDVCCVDCGELITKGSDVPAGTEHNMYSESIKKAVCNAYEVVEYYCYICDHSYTEENEEDGFGDHEYVVTGYVAPTCTKEGNSGTSKCKHCGDIKYTDKVVKAYHNQTDEDGHNSNYLYYENKRTETCMVDGYTGDVMCPHCGEIIEKGMNISATGHIFEDGQCTECNIYEDILPISADGYYEIDSADDIAVFMMNSHRGIKGKITKDIEMPDNFEYEDLLGSVAEKSILDGGNHTISNWNLNSEYYLFDSVEDSTIKNLKVEVNVPEGNENDGNFGVIAVNAYNSVFENITVNGVIIDIYDNDNQGGLVGFAESCQFIKCTNNADITVDGGNAGGIVGDGKFLVFTDCVNNGDIHAVGDEVGGIVGEVYTSKFINCKNTGKITTEDEQAGGIVGVTYDALIDGCTNDGDVQYVGTDKSQDEFGGIVGVAYYESVIKNCVNNGDIGGTHEDVEEAGGIAGQMYYGGKIANCINNGNINAPDNRAGGIVGDHEHDDGDTYKLEIIGCTNNGNVYSYEYSAGIIGEGISVKVEGCSNNGNITGEEYVAGIVGYGKEAIINNCYNTGKSDDGTGLGIANSGEDIIITNSEASHTHKFDGHKVIKPATNTEDGEAEIVCKCGATNGEKVVLKKTGSNEPTTKPSKEEPTTKVTKPVKTKIKSIKNIKKKKIKLTWKKIKGAKGYQVRYATNKKFKKAKIKTIKKNKTKVILKKLKKKRYYVQVRAYKVSNGKKVVGKWSKRKSIKVTK